MNNLLRNVLIRRSIYTFDPRPLRDDELMEILEEGKLLSDAASNHIWHFTVIQNRGIIHKIAEGTRQQFSRELEMLVKSEEQREDQRFLQQIPVLLVISGCTDKKYSADAANTVFGGMMLAAEKYSIGSCWLSAIPGFLCSEQGEDIQNLISIPEGYEPLCAEAFGYRESERITEITSMDNIVNIVK